MAQGPAAAIVRGAGRLSTGLRRTPRFEDPNRVAQVPALACSLQDAALAAEVGQRLMAAWADG